MWFNIYAKQNPTKTQSAYNKFAAVVALLGIFGAFGVFVTPQSAKADFASRCSATGVVLCTGFDSFNEVDSFAYGNENGDFLATFNTVNKASGAGSMQFEIPGLTPANSSGGWERVVDEFGNGFGPGETFYVQYRQRFSSAMFNTAMGGSGWKQSEITTTFGGYGDPVEIGLFNQNIAGATRVYKGATVYTPSATVNYVADEWMTFYVRVQIGTWNSANSSISVWAARENQPLTQIVNQSSVTLTENPNDPGSGYNKIILGPNNSNKLATTAHTPAFTWYDELIVSTSPIEDPGLDSQAPTVPTGLAATAVSATQVNLIWNASTDNVGVTSYRVFRNGTQVANPITNSYQNSGLTASTNYNYTVAAVDAAGNVSAQSTSVSVTTPAAPDTQAPSVPTGLTATVISSTQINLTWNASTDNVGVTGYRLFRNSTQIASPTGTSHQNVGLTPATTYSFAVAAFDAAGNVSIQSAAVTATTQAAADTTAPSAPTGLAASVVSSTQINISWNASTDNVAVTGYKVFRNGTEVGTTTTTSYQNTGLTGSTAYTFAVRAFDAAGNNSSQSNTITATTQSAPDTQAPTVPLNFSATAVSTTQINLTWTASSDNVGVAGYRIYRNGSLIETINTTSLQNTGLTPATSYSYTVAAFDAAGNASAQSTAVLATTQTSSGGGGGGGSDTIAPSIPGSLTATAVSAHRINLAWSPSGDNVAVAGYKIFRNGTQVGTTTSTSYQDTGLAVKTTYRYRVSAYDTSNNNSGLSAEAVSTTPNDKTPTISNFSATTTGIVLGQSTTITWDVADATEVIIDQGIGRVPNTGSATVSPRTSTNYVLTANGPEGATVRSVMVNVIDPTAPTTSYRDGTLILDRGTIYITEYGLKRRIVNMAAFNGLGYKLINTVKANITNIREGNPIGTSNMRHTRGNVVLDSTGTVYFMGTDLRYPFPSAQVFLSWGVDFGDIVPMNSFDAAVPIGPIVQMR